MNDNLCQAKIKFSAKNYLQYTKFKFTIYIHTRKSTNITKHKIVHCSSNPNLQAILIGFLQ